MAFQIVPWPIRRRSARDSSLTQRLHAWWHGYDLEAIRRHRLAVAAAAAAAEAAPAPDDDASEAAADEPAHDWTAGWDASRRKMADTLWTPGFIVPGGSGYVEELVNGCGLTTAETLLEIGVGMGGGTRTIVAKFGNYVTGYERDSELADEARRRALAFDMDGKVEIVSAPLESLNVRRSFFRAALLRDVLFTVEDKMPLLETVCGGLKSGESHVVITDLMLAADAEGPALRAWMEGESPAVHPWTLAELKSCLKRCNVKLRTEDDESERYCQMITSAWTDYLSTLKGKEMSEAFGPQVMTEAAYWTRRVAAVESGALRYYVVKAVRTS